MNWWAFLIIIVLVWTLLHFVTWKVIKAWWMAEFAKLHLKQDAAIEQNQKIIAAQAKQEEAIAAVQVSQNKLNNDRNG